jgi:hypothetical protein
VSRIERVRILTGNSAIGVFINWNSLFAIRQKPLENGLFLLTPGIPVRSVPNVDILIGETGMVVLTVVAIVDFKYMLTSTLHETLLMQV